MNTTFQLKEQQIIAFVPTSDADKAKSFYRDRLGLPLVSEELPFALVFDARGIMLRVTIVGQFSPAGHTILGWRVPDVALAAKALQEAGVPLQRYPGMQQDELGIWAAPGGTKIAWFKDPDGNTLSISQHE
jgi:catechol 2,3-dioxygenase-like lactoylglutathione lyase family enzyme